MWKSLAQQGPVPVAHHRAQKSREKIAPWLPPWEKQPIASSYRELALTLFRSEAITLLHMNG